jgi:DNA-binding response OmpR family regulator
MQTRQTVVLLIEENAAVRDALEQALEREEFRVVPASNGDALTEQQPYDLALIDVNNQRRNSFETFRKLNQSKPRLPIILISSQPELLNHPAAARAAARMLKPLEIHLLCRTVRDLTDGLSGPRGQTAAA